MFIGIDLNKALLEAALDTCLLTTAESAAHTAWCRARHQAFHAARASVPDSGDVDVDEDLRAVAVGATMQHVGPHPLATEDPFAQWAVGCGAE